jgi:hypothetical protein
MATGPEHYQAAERLINAATSEGGSANDTTIARACTALAQVHATLAQAAATAMAAYPNGTGMHSDDFNAWDKVAGENGETVTE